MRMRYFGDSYDVVKQSLLRWLGDFGKWSVHPMFTEMVFPTDVAAYESLIGARVISTEVLKPASDRRAYFDCASTCGHLFIDPDTGLRMLPKRRVQKTKYLYADELLRLTKRRPNSLTVIFDQSVPRSKEQGHLVNKLLKLRTQDLFGFAYVSHACFVVVGRDRSLVNRARARVIAVSRLPEKRFLPVLPG